ncbi:glycosyltransferase family 4 protein [Aeromonas hydrophila]|uniref:glycosyltransferase family 4 protein n=1 Tax=Aeromonas hydrophila TaxID=644 RepID=UPI00209D297A|nr:glycosyltransferase family 4 protein [Aeromonas hydrophila]MCP1265093.1 glycosyltransferase family 4 protein [Aeromonas hydrophila]MCP1293608.1 glycosyltransferase family 4 protein [Aeromonas hydrophila]
MMTKVKVLFLTRGSSNVISGGDVVQLRQTALGLEKLGYDVFVTNDLSYIDTFQPDIIHFSGINLQHNLSVVVKKVRRARLERNIKLAISTIYVNYESYELNIRRSFIVSLIMHVFGYKKLEYLKELVRLRCFKITYLLDFIFRPSGFIYNEYLKDIDLFLPNSSLEAEKIKLDFNIAENKIHPITNGCNLSEIDNKDVIPYKNFVLCVARIEELKNQVALVKACKSAGLNLILVGSLSHSQKKYYNEIYKHLDEKRIYIGSLSQEELVPYYKACSAHALVSHFETCGLSTMEAIHFKKSIVVSDVGYVKSVFDNLPFYCDPNDIPSITQALKNAVSSSIDDRLYEDFIEKTAWSVAAHQTHLAYQGL